MEHESELDPLVLWDGRGYPPAVERLRDRLRRNGQWDRLEVGRGWWPLLVRLDERLAQVVDFYGAESIREVDGLLQFYASSSPDSVAFTDLIWEGMLDAKHTCTACGRPGVRRRDDGGRSFTRCDEHARPLEERERGPLASAGGPPPVTKWDVVDPVATHRAVSEIFAASVSRTHLGAEDIAAVLGMTTDEAYRLYLHGELVGARGERSQVVYPRWQLHEGARIPGLSEVTWRVNYAWNALDARAVMLRPNAELKGLSPVEWLVAGYPVAAVTALLLSLEYEGMPGPATEYGSTGTPEGGLPLDGTGDEDEIGEMGYVERVWREVLRRLQDRLGRSELAAALGAYAADSQDRLRIADVRRIRAEYGTPREPDAEALLPLLLARGEGRRDDTVA